MDFGAAQSVSKDSRRAVVTVANTAATSGNH